MTRGTTTTRNYSVNANFCLAGKVIGDSCNSLSVSNALPKVILAALFSIVVENVLLLAKQYRDRTFLALFDLQTKHFEINPKKESAFFIAFPLSDSKCEIKKRSLQKIK